MPDVLRVPRWLSVVMSLMLALLCGCDGPIPPEPSRPAFIAPDPSGLGGGAARQFGAPGQIAFFSPTVVVIDQRLKAMPGVLVHFTTTTGGRVEHSRAVTDGLGQASAGDWTLRSTEGDDEVIAVVEGLPAVQFRARVRHATELARYALTTVGKVPLPADYLSWTAKAALMSFYDDATFVMRFAMESGPSHTFEYVYAGSYSRTNGSVRWMPGSSPVDTPFTGTVLSNRLLLTWDEPEGRADEEYIKVSSNPPWPQ